MSAEKRGRKNRETPRSLSDALRTYGDYLARYGSTICERYFLIALAEDEGTDSLYESR